MKDPIQQQIENLSQEIYEKKKQLSELRRQRPAELVEDYIFTTSQGEVKLSELFKDKQDLIVIHNMGKGCSYCTLWADGFESSLAHLQNRTEFVVSSPDAPSVQDEFAKSRNWTFPMVSTEKNSFIADMGYARDKHTMPQTMPGVSVFCKSDDGKIYRTNQDVFGPGDDFNAVWHFFDLLKDGANNWQPKLSYS